MNESGSNTVATKSCGDRKFYCFPNEYSVEQQDPTDSIKTTTLLNEIYANISSHEATFDGPFGSKSVIYCDYAASGQPLNFIEDYIRQNALPFYGNTHTTITATSSQSTYFRHEAKDIIRKSINASEHDAIIFTGNGCTSAVNKLIHALNFQLPVVVFVGPFEHHSNLLPWKEINAEVIRIKEDVNGLVDLKCLENELQKYSGKDCHLIGSFSAASNITGILTDDIAVSILLHRYEALSFWDYACAGPYVKIDMNPVITGENEGLAYKDAVFLSPHKFAGGPDTPGILAAKKTLFRNPVPQEPGGGTIFFVTRDTHRYLKDVEMREEGGTPSIIGAIRAGMVFQLKDAVSTKVIAERDGEICSLVLERCQNIPELKLLGSSSASRLPIFSFVISHPKSGLYLHHNFVTALLNDLFGIQSRSGCACAGPYALDLLGINEDLAQRFDTLLAENSLLDRTHLRRQREYSEREVLRPGFVRIAFPFFMPDEDINYVVDAIALIAKNGWKLLPQYIFNPETGEWKHKLKQVVLGRKWLGSISYKDGFFSVKGEQFSEKPASMMDMLRDAETQFQNAEQMATKKFTPDQQLVFDTEASEIRWFLLPSEATQYLTGSQVKPIKNPVFVVRTAKQIPHAYLNGSSNGTLDSPLKLVDENCNVQDGNVVCPERDRLCLEEEINNNQERQITCSLRNKLVISNPSETSEALRKCKWFSPPGCIFRPFLKAVNEFNMIQPGDRVLVCLSGGKDSLSLLHTLRQHQFYAKKKDVLFELGAMTVDPKSPSYDPSPLKGYLKALNVPYFYEEQDIISQAANVECSSICSFCSRLKRGRIYACARREGYNVIALGQHLDDLAESFLMSVFHNGRLRTMKAHYTDESSSLRIIRPFVFVREKDLRQFSEQKKLPVIPENCPACFEAPKERHRMKQLLASQEVQFPMLYRSLRTAMYPLMAINQTGIEDKLLGKYSNFSSNDCSIDDDID
ncbi:uncharacterized protein LOC129231354 [Uloborus diversus]|uniref:uncharacterized protein LOC129231354 n=1 Tax=Uloborus diversus TaxID=327109 RepID=UPI0024091371|nr:uncharacterized protein LOC129231354 [Uloborus diversus]